MLGSDSRCLLIYVGEGAVEAMEIVRKYSFEGLEVEVVDIRAPVVRKLRGLIVTVAPLQ